MSQLAKWWRRGFPFVLLGISLFAVFQVYQNNKDQQDFISCQARYNEINNQRTRSLTEVADRERIANQRVQNANAALWLNPSLLNRESGDPIDPSVLKDFRELQEALTNWRDVIMQANKERLENPVPPAPSSICGEAKGPD